MASEQQSVMQRMFARKTIAQVQRESASSELKRSLGKWNLLLLGVGCIIGAGIFVRTGSAAALHAGPAVMLSFVVAGIGLSPTGSPPTDVWPGVMIVSS